MRAQRDDCIPEVSRILSEQFEQDFQQSISAQGIAEKGHLYKQRVHDAIDFLIAHGYAEEANRELRHSRVHFTPLGKEKYDHQIGNVENERIRDSILSKLVESYAEQPERPVRSDELEQKLQLTANTICMNLAIMEEHSLVELKALAGAGRAYFRICLAPKGKNFNDNPPNKSRSRI